MALVRVALNNAVFIADGRNDPDANIVVTQAAALASVTLFTDVSIPLFLSLCLALPIDHSISQSLLHPVCPSLLCFKAAV